MARKVMGANGKRYKVKKPFYKRIWFWVIIVVLVAGIGGSLGTDKESATKTSSSHSVTESSNNTSATIEELDTNENVPSDYKSALTQADSYSKTMHMSKQGIYDQLISEYGGQFTAEAAQYAIDNVSADWNANALASAENYSNTLHLSKAGIYDQLIAEAGDKFTAEEAQYAIDTIQADWNANALESAKNYQDTMAMSPDAIYDQLISEYGDKFTADEATYAVQNLN